MASYAERPSHPPHVDAALINDLQAKADGWARRVSFSAPVRVVPADIGLSAIARRENDGTAVVLVGTEILRSASPEICAAAVAHEVVHFAEGDIDARLKRRQAAYQRLGYCSGLLAAGYVPAAVIPVFAGAGRLWAPSVAGAVLGLAAFNRLLLEGAEAARSRREEVKADVLGAGLMGDTRPMEALLTFLAAQLDPWESGPHGRLSTAIRGHHHPPFAVRLAALRRAAPAIAAEAAQGRHAGRTPRPARRSTPLQRPRRNGAVR